MIFISQFIIYLMVVFMALGAIDRMLGNKFGLGKEFENGIMAIGPLALSMWGIICFAPVLADVLRPIVVPAFRLFGADPGMFPGCILACDMGGGPLALELATDPQIGYFGGTIVGSMLGATIVFTIPMVMGTVSAEDRPFMAKGILCGIITIPVGSFVGGLLAGLSLMVVVRNLIPIVIFALLIALGLWKAEKVMIRGFSVFGHIVLIVITLGLACAIIEALTGIVIIPGLAPLSEGYTTVGSIAIVLAGAFPLIYALTKLLNKPLLKLGKVLGMNEVAAAGMVASLANSIPVFGMVKDMDARGKVLNMAFAVSAAFVFGDHLGFTAGFAPELVTAVVVAKLTAGVTAVAVAMLLTRRNDG